MSSDRVESHVAAFNGAVRSGDWAWFAERFASDAELDFEGVPVGPFRGREAVAAAYAALPPTDMMRVLDVESDGESDVARFAWDAGGTGTMRLAWEGDRVRSLVVSFDA